LYAILGEHQSDAETIAVFVRRLLDDERLPVIRRGYHGSGELCRKGARDLRAIQSQGSATRFIVCHDADGPDPSINHERVRREVVVPSGIKHHLCILVPVQELEAWILADETALSSIFTGWKPKSVDFPESKVNPKEHLEKSSRTKNRKARYSHATHNPRVAKYLNLEVVARKCPSFVPLREFVAKDGNA